MIGMIVIFVTAVPMTMLKTNVFLFLIAIFSFYFALVGWRSAKNRKGIPTKIDWGISGIMAVTGIAMLIWGIIMLISNNTNGITIIVFGCLGAMRSISDLRRFRRGKTTGTERIAMHLSMMLGGTIAVITGLEKLGGPGDPPEPDIISALTTLSESWRFEASGAAQPADWRELDFDDSAWGGAGGDAELVGYWDS